MSGDAQQHSLTFVLDKTKDATPTIFPATPLAPISAAFNKLHILIYNF